MTIAKTWRYTDHVYVDYECFGMHEHRKHSDGGWTTDVSLILPQEVYQQLPNGVAEVLREARRCGQLGWRVTREHWGL